MRDTFPFRSCGSGFETPTLNTRLMQALLQRIIPPLEAEIPSSFEQQLRRLTEAEKNRPHKPARQSPKG